jgi:hypothetical protein
MTPMNQPHLWQCPKCGKAPDVAQLLCRATLNTVGRYFSFGFSLARFSAVPRMSPNVAPESEEPY